MTRLFLCLFILTSLSCRESQSVKKMFLRDGSSSKTSPKQTAQVQKLALDQTLTFKLTREQQTTCPYLGDLLHAYSEQVMDNVELTMECESGGESDKSWSQVEGQWQKDDLELAFNLELYHFQKTGEDLLTICQKTESGELCDKKFWHYVDDQSFDESLKDLKVTLEHYLDTATQ